MTGRREAAEGDGGADRRGRAPAPGRARPAGAVRARIAARIALWTACGVVLAGMERLLPSPLPWVRLGLANGAALVVLYGIGWRAALGVNLLRAAVVAALFGTWASPAFLLSLGGGVAAVAVMALVHRFAGERVGPVGVSAAGAFAHMLTQFTLVALLIVRHLGVLALVGPSLVAAILAGAIVGSLADLLLRRLPPGLVRAA